jgi:crotonobetainyl-CoA:carnitine CoA-transferase CaiB-like acyl-CoA transferase
MKEGSEKTQVFSKHLTGKGTLKRLSMFDKLLTEMMGSVEEKPGAIEDITVVEVSQANFAGIISAALLGEFGAEVIKIEPPEGDPARKITPYGKNVDGVGLPFLMESRNKYNITMDLNSPEGQEDFRKLINKADVLIDAVKPGSMDALGIGYRQLRQLNPGLIYVAISPYGHFTSKAEDLHNVPDTDLTAQAGAGYPSLTGDPAAEEPYNYPIKAGIWAAWYMSAVLATTGTLTALIHKRKTGEGQMVDIATNDAISAWQGFQLVWGFTMEQPRVRVGNFDWCIFPYGYYKTKDDRYVTVAAAQDADFRGVLKILGRWDLEKDWRFLFDRITDDVENLKQLENEIKKEVAKYTSKELASKSLAYSAKAARDRMRSKGFPIMIELKTPPEVMKEKHWQIRKSFQEMDHPVCGKFTIPASVPKMSESPPRVKWIRCGIGEDNEYIYGKYGLGKGKK